ncbi:protein translocase subunit SecF [Patescibacteria group bacterium]|nr:protein translocase subunit SecF [Patescibacteria group bacterium]
MKRFLNWKIIATLLLVLVFGFYSLPQQTQKTILPFLPDSITNTKIHLGLDLQGGSQLDYKIDLRKVPEADREDIIDGVLEVIERRVNGLGVAEPNIYTSEIAGENHIVVELAESATISQEDVDTYLGKEGVKVGELTDDQKKLVSLEKAKATVGKTIQLEFKEEKQQIDPEEKDRIHEDAQKTLNKIKEGADYEVVAQEEVQAFPGLAKHDTSEYVFESELPSYLKEKLTTMEIGEFYGLIETGGTFVINESGQAVEDSGYGIVKLVDVDEAVKDEKEVAVSHILIAYAGSEQADESITRTKEEAYELAKEIKAKVDQGEDFAILAQENSDDASNKDQGGRLSTPVTGDGTYVYDFEQAALAFEKSGDISDIVNTKFGYHIIKADEVLTDIKEKQYKYELLTYSTLPNPWKETGLTGKHFIHADVQLDQFYQPYVTIQFNDEGAKLFEEITERNVGKRVAIFVGGDQISAPEVQGKIAGGSAQITGEFTTDEAKNLARDLNTGAIPAPIVLTGEYTIGATLGHEALTKSLTAGLIGLALVIIFMVLYYRAAGIMAAIALVVYASIFLFLIKSELHVGIALLGALAVFGFLVFKIINNKDSAWEKTLSFLLSCVGFFFLIFLLKTGIVLTLAGVAGIILSIGMAVDANILIFERFKEELKEGKPYKSAVESGFNRAWSAIRDSNFSTLLTCAILFYFGSSIIKGFAFNLAAGILVSMFTAITVTKTLLQSFIGTKLAENLKAFGVNPAKKENKFNFIKNSKTWLTVSGGLVTASLAAIIIFGLNLGLDFTGGSLMEFKFSEPVEKQVLADTLVSIEEEMQDGSIAVVNESPKETVEGETVISADPTTKIDLTNIQILASEENSFVVKTKYLDSSAHKTIVEKMKETLPEFTEPRFTTIGPVIGKTLLEKAVIAIIFALVMIIIYVAIAFRKVPKEVSPWRFGACAIAALAHDMLIVTGVFVILGQFFNVEIDALFITAMLTVFGYSVNDTIVIFDRLRERLITKERDETLEHVANQALRQSFTRSINTSLSTLFTLVAVLLLGSPSIFYFILALTLGTIVGTYSSIFTATPLLIKWTLRAEKKKERTDEA